MGEHQGSVLAGRGAEPDWLILLDIWLQLLGGLVLLIVGISALVFPIAVQSGARVWIVGGAATAAACIALGAVDTIELFLMPVLLGEGVPLLVGDGAELPLALRETRAWPNGVVGLTYEVT